MGWDYEESKRRLAEEWKRIDGAKFVVKKLTREMNLSNLGLTEGRLVHGVHVYAGIPNFPAVLEDPTLRRDDSKRLHRYLHVVRIEQRRIIQSIFDGDKIQVQGPKFHGLLYKPYDDDTSLAWNSVLAGLALHLLLSRAVPEVFEHYPRLESAIGLDLGDAMVVNIGIRGDRELISVGCPANHAAKILGISNTLTVGKNVYDCLSRAQKALFSEVGDVYRLRPGSLPDAEEMIRDEGFVWSVEQSADRMAESLDQLPLDDILIEEARERIDPLTLGPRRAKICEGASIFVDVDGYTKLIDSLVSTGDLQKITQAVKWLHLFRYELRHVTECDFDGVTIQHQGDRLQALFHMPAGYETRVLRKAIDACVSYNSSVEEILNIEHNIVGKIHVAIGCAFGKTLVSRTGVRGDLDLTCLARTAQLAETMQTQMKGNETGITSDMYESISDETVKAMFSLDGTRECYVGSNVTWTAIEDAERSGRYELSAKASYTTAGTIAVGDSIPVGARSLKVTRPWST
jgi:class 3 adenylate cyclase